jgi:hypothetical protein
MSCGQGNGARGGMAGMGEERGGAGGPGGNWAVDGQHGTGVEGSSPSCTEGQKVTTLNKDYFLANLACPSLRMNIYVRLSAFFSLPQVKNRPRVGIRSCAFS